MEANANCLRERKLWNELKNGSQDAFLGLYEDFYQSLYAYGIKLSKNQELTKDVIQEIFLELWQRHSDLPEVQHVKAYLFTYLRRRVLKEINIYMNDTSAENLGEDQFECTISRESIWIEEETDRETIERLNLLMASLTKRQREIIHLKFYEKLSYEQISKIMSVQYQSVINLSHEALKLLRKGLVTVFFIILKFF